jgi:hypothetical protein
MKRADTVKRSSNGTCGTKRNVDKKLGVALLATLISESDSQRLKVSSWHGFFTAYEYQLQNALHC